MRKWMNLFEMSAGEAQAVFFKLGVDTEEMSKDELKKAYRKLMMQHHPDTGGDLEQAKELSVAYTALQNRDAMDRLGKKYRPEEPAAPSVKKDFRHIDYVKQWFEEQVEGQPAQMWTVFNFDGHFFRGQFTVRANHTLFPKMAEIMRFWDFHGSEAILVGTRSMLEKGTIAVIDVRGEIINPFVTLYFDSPNLNPSNDAQFTNKLPRYLDLIATGEFSSQGMVD